MTAAGPALNILILDACRNNPFLSRWPVRESRGLAPMQAVRGSFIAYATAPGAVAADGVGRNGHDVPGLAIGVLKEENSVEMLSAVIAWKIDEKQMKFVKLQTEGLRCSRNGISTADGGR